MAKSQFETFLREEVNKVKGIYYPVRAGCSAATASGWTALSTAPAI